MRVKKLFSKVGNTTIVPLGMKILIIFISLILISNLATNIISLQLSQKQIINLNNQIMVEQLKELYSNSSNQYQIYAYTQNKLDSVMALKKAAGNSFTNKNSMAMGVNPDGTIAFMACANMDNFWSTFLDEEALNKINTDYANGIQEGSINFDTAYGPYFGVYKYQADWNYFIIRAEKRSDLAENNKKNYLYISIIILILTFAFIVIGFIILNRQFKTVREITNDLYEMQKDRRLSLIDLSKAPNDDITYLAASFNSLSSSVNNLLGTFQKFVPKDIVTEAYSGEYVGIKGGPKELTMLFSDIKSFTYRTEILGNEIQEILKLHYDRVINTVYDNAGEVGSIIGDAILAVFGTKTTEKSKSLESIEVAWGITHKTAELRQLILERKEEIEKIRPLTESELLVYDAVSLDVGVGIDAGNVFYGTIGRDDLNITGARMTNTVIGDTVNSASRLEGLTRIYHVPVITSESVKNEVEKVTERYKFFEIDTVQVKGKTEGKKIYFPFDTAEMDNALLDNYEIFEKGLTAYYEGDWKTARKNFKDSQLNALTEVFFERIGTKNAPEGWNGIWTMTSK